MEATNKGGEISLLQYPQENEAISMLGLYLALNTNNKCQIKYTNKKAAVYQVAFILLEVAP